MINSVKDLKRRTLVESNTLKSFILSNNEGFTPPSLDDILIHDYQIANSATLNTIASNFIVNLKGAWGLYFTNDGSVGDSYFKIVNGLDAAGISQLDDNTRLILDMDEDDGTFKTRTLEYDVQEIQIPEGTVQFVNVDSVWYGIARTPVINLDYCDVNGNPCVDEDGELTFNDGQPAKNGLGQPIDQNGDVVLDEDGKPMDFEDVYYLHDDNGELVYSDKLKIVEGMNDFVVNPNPFGDNPFDKEGGIDASGISDDYTYDSFNGLLDSMSREHKALNSVNCIVENLFYKNRIQDGDSTPIGAAMYGSRYIMCVQNRLLGLEDRFPTEDGVKKFSKFVVHDIGSLIPNIDQSLYSSDRFEFMTCGFHAVDETTTLFIVFKDSRSGRYHYAFMNEGSYDNVYGFTQINQASLDSLITDVDRVFRKVQSIKSLGNHTIAMTDYGFWDIEPNQTRSVTYSYRGLKEVEPDVTLHVNGKPSMRNSKVVSPETSLGEDDIVVECQYKDENGELTAGNTVVQKIWTKPNGNFYVNDGNDIKYIKDIVGVYDSSDPKPKHELYGCTDNFAMYNSTSAPEES